MHTSLTKPVYTCSTVNTRHIIHVLASVVLANYNTGTCSRLKEDMHMLIYDTCSELTSRVCKGHTVCRGATVLEANGTIMHS